MVTTRLPSAGFSITIRIAVTADASSIGRLTTCVGEAGAIVTALDVVDSDPTRVLVDLTCDTADSSHADQVVKTARGAGRGRRPQGLRPDVPAAPRRQDRGQLEGRAAQPRRAVPGVHPGRGPGLHGDRGEPGRRPPAHHQAQHGRRGQRRLGGARPGQHRPGRRDAGDGGQGRAVQAVRRGGRLAGGAGHPGHRRDRRDRQGDRARPTAASTWRTSPRRAASRSRRGCASCWTSRSSTTTSTAPRSACWPR